jgi:hypothetical protein
MWAPNPGRVRCGPQDYLPLKVFVHHLISFAAEIETDPLASA